MPVLLSSPPENVPRPIYVLPNSQHISVNQGKRGREDDSNDSVPVVDSVKRVKSLEPVRGPKSTHRAIKDARKSRTKDTKEKHYEYGSDTDEEDPPSDPEEPMLTADEDAAFPTDVDEDQEMTDISEETFRAEMDQIFVGSDELVKTFFATDSDSELADDESDLNVDDTDKATKPKVPTAPAEKTKVIEWAQPGPSPLRHELHLAPDRPKAAHTICRNKDGLIAIVRSSRHAQGVDRENTRREVVRRYHCRCTHLPCTDRPLWPRRSGKSLGKEKALPLVDNDGNVIASSWADDAKQTGRGMGCGTPPRFCRWTPLTPPPSPYNYSTPDDTIPFEQFGQGAFHGADAWGTLSRPVRRSTQAVDGRTSAGYVGPLRHWVQIGTGPTWRQVEVHTDVRALQHLRAHGVGLEKMPRLVRREHMKRVTTRMVLEHEARMESKAREEREQLEREAWIQALQLMQRARAPSPEQMEVVDEDESMDMVLIDEDDAEELGPWLPWMP
ncbi:hypothetical protein V8D89_001781 [Ganoderma adspersum]